MAADKLYRVSFHNQGKVYEVYARRVSDAGMLGFVCVEELTFGERGGVVVDPSEERIRDEFTGVRRSYLPMHCVIRIDEVDKQGVSKISSGDGDNITPFPMPMYPPGGKGKGPGGSS